ncbi:unnamed protein product [Heligmosomoides polygyrus]|uniref:C2H2-type domain-containing protein n=1 Tax=Heligmosomoides polygyrus TaxID=6339 RepID=A0A183FKT7_HELPZ|nr:unnamed protein product [Heligmosomoides polygyrus]
MAQSMSGWGVIGFCIFDKDSKIGEHEKEEQGNSSVDVGTQSEIRICPAVDDGIQSEMRMRPSVDIRRETKEGQMHPNVIVQRQRKGVRKRRKRGILFSHKKRGGRLPRSATIVSFAKDNSSDLPIIQCHCGASVKGHTSLHEHVVKEHPVSMFDRCSYCNLPEMHIRNMHTCSICGVFAEYLDDHLRIHYQDCTAKGALMECRTCPRKFYTVAEVRQHEQLKHGSGTNRTFFCEFCSKGFPARHPRDCHLVSHFEQLAGDSLWERIAQMETTIPDHLIDVPGYICPFCSHFLRRKYNFRFHVVRRHLMANEELLAGFMKARPLMCWNRISVKQEHQEVLENQPPPLSSCIAASSLPVMREIKQEILD